MNQYKIKSPSGKVFKLTADSIYHAVQKAVELESYKYSNFEYLKINK